MRAFESSAAVSDQRIMTLNGTIWKTALSLVVLFVGAVWSWRVVPAAASGPWMIAGIIGTLVLALITCFNPKAAPITTPLYAGLEGLLLGTISSFYDARFPGIVMQALTLTGITATVMLVVYRTGLIRPTEKFRSFVVIATASIFGIYLIDLILGLFGRGMPISSSTGMFGILFSLFVVGIAALNLILDFGRIEEGVNRGAPKYMEWYGAFALMVTLIWLYLEMLRLLSKLQSRR
jgi:uncharacterized YccA/Bax inhibitor family protein